MNTIHDVKLISLRGSAERNGTLVFLEVEKDIPIIIKRVFIVTATENAVRGDHAHRQLTQVMICTNGILMNICDDGKNKKTFQLSSPQQALYVPPGIWSSQLYQTEGTVLVVLCDDFFDEADYIRDYSAYVRYREELECLKK
ncbi:MAG: WxcM-like domain-containing protein [Gammaproteobacteria bacterium]|nr:WxcM-like domain-containing protein [Gammaproteobacteria bacterium]